MTVEKDMAKYNALILAATQLYHQCDSKVTLHQFHEDDLFLEDVNNEIAKVVQTPVYALLLEGCLACIYVLSGSFDLLTNLAMFMVWFFFIIAVAGIFKLRKNHKDLATDYKVPL